MSSAVGEVSVRPGDILAGKYRVERVLGSGGMGVVVSAHHMQLDERVAIKFLLPEALKNAEAVARFDREARAVAKIKSEHVARVIDVGQLDTGAPYIVMEYLDGGDLAAWLTQRGAMSVEQAVEFVLQACEAIAEAHALGIVHRDLKPANLFCILRADGLLSVKVLDFGISKATGVAASSPNMAMTRTQSIIGSPLYMSPEQMQSSKAVDTRADIWGLGVILFELLARRVPFEGETIPELAIKIVSAPTPSLRAIRPDIPDALDQVIRRCLEKDREKRFHDVGEFARAVGGMAPERSRPSVDRITRVIQASGLSASGLGPATSTGERLPVNAATMSAWGTTATGSKGRTVALALVVGAGAAIAVVAALLSMRRPAAPVVVSSPGMVLPLPSDSSPVTLAPPRQSADPAAPSDKPGGTAALAPMAPGGSATPAIPTGSAGDVAPAGRLPRPAAAAQPAKPAANCNPPYYYDSQGNRNFKKECL
jgi:serine/threonine-protein kinase